MNVKVIDKKTQDTSEQFEVRIPIEASLTKTKKPSGSDAAATENSGETQSNEGAAETENSSETQSDEGKSE